MAVLNDVKPGRFNLCNLGIPVQPPTVL